MQREQNRFLRHKGLNGVGAQDLGWQVHLPKAHALNGDGAHCGQQEELRKSAKKSGEAETTVSRDTDNCMGFKAFKHETSPPHCASFA
jgi:hypothetical protein